MGDHTVNRRWSELLTDYSIVLTENSINEQKIPLTDRRKTLIIEVWDPSGTPPKNIQ